MKDRHTGRGGRKKEIIKAKRCMKDKQTRLSTIELKSTIMHK